MFYALRDLGNMLCELVENALHSTPQGFVGVSLIFFYFALIVCTAIYRSKKGDHLEHHH